MIPRPAEPGALTVVPSRGETERAAQQTRWPSLSALGKLFRTTAFKLTLVYLTVFALFAAFLLGYFAWNTRRLITDQITQTVDSEIADLTDELRQSGIRRLVFAIDARATRPSSNPYLLT